MAQDKQLLGIKLRDVLQRRRLDQALNAKEFAVLAGVAYSTAREWFRLPGFPTMRGVVFWRDFVRWRQAQMGMDASQGSVPRCTEQGLHTPLSGSDRKASTLSPRAAQILAEAG